MGPHLHCTTIFAVVLIKIYVSLLSLAVANTLAQRYVTTDCHMHPPPEKNPFLWGLLAHLMRGVDFSWNGESYMQVLRGPYGSEPLSFIGGPIYCMGPLNKILGRPPPVEKPISWGHTSLPQAMFPSVQPFLHSSWLYTKTDTETTPCVPSAAPACIYGWRAGNAT